MIFNQDSVLTSSLKKSVREKIDHANCKIRLEVR